MKKSKLFLTLGLTLLLSLVLVACGGGSDSKSDKKGSDSGKASGEQVLNLTESALIPSADSTKADDQVGLNVVNQTNKVYMRLTKMVFLPLPVLLKSQKLAMTKQFILSNFVKMQNGQTETL